MKLLTEKKIALFHHKGPCRIVRFFLLGVLLPFLLLVVPLTIRFFITQPKAIRFVDAGSHLLDHQSLVSSSFCKAQNVRLNSSFHAYVFTQKPVITSQTERLSVEEDMMVGAGLIKYWSFNLLEGSSIRVNGYADKPGASISVIKHSQGEAKCELMRKIQKSRREEIRTKIEYQSLDVESSSSEETVDSDEISEKDNLNVLVSSIDATDHELKHKNNLSRSDSDSEEASIDLSEEDGFNVNSEEDENDESSEEINDHDGEEFEMDSEENQDDDNFNKKDEEIYDIEEHNVTNIMNEDEESLESDEDEDSSEESDEEIENEENSTEDEKEKDFVDEDILRNRKNVKVNIGGNNQTFENLRIDIEKRDVSEGSLEKKFDIEDYNETSEEIEGDEIGLGTSDFLDLGLLKSPHVARVAHTGEKYGFQSEKFEPGACTGLLMSYQLEPKQEDNLQQEGRSQTIQIQESGVYYVIVSHNSEQSINMASNIEQTINMASVNLNLERTLYNTSNSIDNCSSRESCDLYLNFMSDHNILIQIPESEDNLICPTSAGERISKCNSYNYIHGQTTCNPRGSIQLLFLLTIPVVILVSSFI